MLWPISCIVAVFKVQISECRLSDGKNFMIKVGLRGLLWDWVAAVSKI